VAHIGTASRSPTRADVGLVLARASLQDLLKKDQIASVAAIEN